MWALILFLIFLCSVINRAENSHFNPDCSINPSSPIAVTTGHPLSLVNKRDDLDTSAVVYGSLRISESFPSSPKWIAKEAFSFLNINPASMITVETFLSSNWWFLIEYLRDTDPSTMTTLVDVDSSCFVQMARPGFYRKLNFYAKTGLLTRMEIIPKSSSAEEFNASE